MEKFKTLDEIARINALIMKYNFLYSSYSDLLVHKLKAPLTIYNFELSTELAEKITESAQNTLREMIEELKKYGVDVEAKDSE